MHDVLNILHILMVGTLNVILIQSCRQFDFSYSWRQRECQKSGRFPFITNGLRFLISSFMMDGTFPILLLESLCAMLILFMFKMNQAKYFWSPDWVLLIEIGSTLKFLSAKENTNVDQ